MAPADLGMRIRRARERKRWSQRQLADAVSAGTRTVGRWERGEAVPRNRIGTLEQVLGIRLSEGGDEEERYTDPAEVAIWEIPALPASEKRVFIAQLRAKRREHAPRAHEPPA